MSTIRTTTGFILAGGQSSRMGRDKALLDWHGQPLVDHMRQLLSTACDLVVVVGRNELPDEVVGLGPIGGIVTAVRHTVTDFNIVTAVDLPLLTTDFLIHFKQRCIQSSSPLTVCKIDSQFPLCLGLRTELRASIEDYVRQGNRSVFGLIQRTDHETITGIEARLFFNLNTIEDYAHALSLSNS